MDRKAYLISQIAQHGRGLEIGASYNPVVTKASGAKVEILDYAPTAELREKYRGIAGLDISKIEEVDYVSDGRPMVEIIGETGVYDYIIASHVIEHTPDIIGFLKDCEALLKPGGRLVLAVPDKRRCFDVFLPVSTTGQAWQAHLEKRSRHSPGAVFDAMANSAESEGQFIWNRGAKVNLSFSRSVEQAWQNCSAYLTSEAYIDVHVWRFTPSSFRMLVSDLGVTGMTRLKEVSFRETDGVEFFATVSTEGAGCPVDRITLAQRVAIEQAEVPIQADPRPVATVATAAADSTATADHTNFGERTSPANKDWGFLAHLSIYEFAAQQAAGKRCLDVGCGTGYGSNHLAERGAGSVVALERDAALVADLQRTYPRVGFQVCDLDQGVIGQPDAAFDLIFTSNVLEHVAYLDPVLAEFPRLLAPGGRVIVAIPPVPNVGVLKENAKNIFHITNLPHAVWQSKLERFFTKVTRHRHWVRPEKNPTHYEIDRSNPALDDFVFIAQPGPEEIEATITAVYLCEDPRPQPLDATFERPIPPEWHHLRVEAEGRQEIYVELSTRLKDTERYWASEVSRLRHWLAEQQKSGIDPDQVLKGVARQLRLLAGHPNRRQAKPKRPPKRRRSALKRAWRWVAKRSGLSKSRGRGRK